MQVHPIFEYVMYAWIAIVCALFGYVAYRRFDDFQERYPLGIILCIVPLVLALMHRRIRMERAKGRNAIYERMVAVCGPKKRRRRS